MAKKRKDAAAEDALDESPLWKRNADVTGDVNWLSVLGAAHNNLRNVDVHFPLARFIAVTGVSGSGKSSLVNDILREALARDLNGAQSIPGKYDRITGIEHLDKIIDIDQSPIGRTPRSNPATYIKVFDRIRTLLSELPAAKARGFAPGRFSFNVEGGRCEACEGNGSNKLEMDFLADVWVTCPVCEGRRFNRQTLDVRFKDKNIHDILEMDVQEAVDHFRSIGPIYSMLKTLHDVGLDYIKLGQPSPTLSGGEAQRIKLARELCKRSTGRTLYVLDEPTTGLHFEDIRKLLDVLHGFVHLGNTVVVIEHNLDVIKTADWLIDLGPEGGGGGGRIVSVGTPEQVADCVESYTGQALKQQFRMQEQLANPSKRKAKEVSKKPALTQSKPYEFLEVEGARQHNLKDVSAKIPLHQMTVFSGPSGSGKSSLAIDTLYAEGHRRYVESLSSYARQFLGQMQKPVVEKISGLPPAISIEQKAPSKSPRSTVGTVTEIYDYFRILFARLGKPFCPKCQIPIGTQTSEEIIDKLLAMPDGTKLYLMAPIKLDHNQDYASLWKELEQSGFVRMRVDGVTHEISAPPEIDKRRKHLVEVVVDRLIIRANQRPRIADSVEAALAKGRGVIHVTFPQEGVSEKKWQVDRYSQHLACDRCGRSFVELTPNHFSFNSPIGWCPQCEGLGTQVGGGGASDMETWQSFSIRHGSISLMADLHDPENPLVGFMTAVAKHVGFSLDSSLKDIAAEKKRLIFHGTGEEWIGLDDTYGTKFQYKGIYPAITEASRLSWVYRNKVSELVGETACSACAGSRLRDDSAAARFSDRTINQWCELPLGQTLEDIKRLELTKTEKQIAGELIREIRNRLEFLVDVGLEYLTLARSTPTLSGGEAQRIRLASQLGSGLTGVLYLLDEPTIGLHPRDTSRLLRALQKLRNLGNTLVLVEHDAEVIASSDTLLDFGPGAGKFGGTIVAQGSPAQVIKKGQSLTGQYLGGSVSIPVPTNRRPITDLKIEIEGANHHNLRDVNVFFPLGCFTAVTGVSGSGKSSLITDILWASLAKRLHRAQSPVGLHAGMKGIEAIDKVINVDQQAIGNTPASNPATYTGVFDLIREVFAQLPDAKVRGYSAGRFSFNKPGGRCEACEGNGQKKIEMHFLPDVWIECDVCKGQRYTPETLAVVFKGKNIAEVLELSVTDALALFANVPKIRKLLQMLDDVGLGYMALGQSAPTLSGGEAQRVKLAAELARPNTGKTLYILDEPTTGLHFDDIRKLLIVLHRLVDLGNTVVVIEHNLDVIKTADWVIDIGPEAGDGGGQVVFTGTPEQMAQYAVSGKSAARGAVAPGRNGGEGAARGDGAGAKDGSLFAEQDPGGATPGLAKKKSKRRAVDVAGSSVLQSDLVSHTARCLLPVMEKSPREEREVYDAKKAALEERKKNDVDIDDVGKDVKMPWELDGKRWHTKDRVSKTGKPCKWEGDALKFVIEQIESFGMFSPTHWNNRSLVEISAAKKLDGWFLHALTSDEWLLELKFRVSRGAFKTELLNRQLGLKPLNEIKEIPVYGGGPRVHVKQTRGLHAEVRLTVYKAEEIETPAFEEFLKKAAESFVKTLKKAEDNPDKATPWLENGLEWHLAEKGFPTGRKVYWNRSITQRLLKCLEKAVPDAKWDYQSRDSVKRRLPGIGMAWARVMTKLPRALELNLTGKKAQFNLAAIDQFGAGHELKTNHAEWDTVKLSFQTDDDWSDRAVIDFLIEHAEGFRETFENRKSKEDDE